MTSTNMIYKSTKQNNAWYWIKDRQTKEILNDCD